MNRREIIIGAASVLTSAVFLPDAVSDSVAVNLGGGSFSLRGWTMAVECGGKIVSERTAVVEATESRSGPVWLLFYHNNNGREWVFRLPIEQHFITNGDTATVRT